VFIVLPKEESAMTDVFNVTHTESQENHGLIIGSGVGLAGGEEIEAGTGALSPVPAGTVNMGGKLYRRLCADGEAFKDSSKAETLTSAPLTEPKVPSLDAKPCEHGKNVEQNPASNNEMPKNESNVVAKETYSRFPLPNGCGALLVSVKRDPDSHQACFGLRMQDSSGKLYLEKLIARSSRKSLRDQIERYRDEHCHKIPFPDIAELIEHMDTCFPELAAERMDLQNFYKKTQGESITPEKKQDLIQRVQAPDNAGISLPGSDSKLYFTIVRDTGNSEGYVVVMLQDSDGSYADVRVFEDIQITRGGIESYIMSLDVHVSSDAMGDMLRALETEDGSIPMIEFPLFEGKQPLTPAQMHNDLLKIGNENAEFLSGDGLYVYLRQDLYNRLLKSSGVHPRAMERYLLGENPYRKPLVKTIPSETLRNKRPGVTTGWYIALDNSFYIDGKCLAISDDITCFDEDIKD
jgi:hypothetical protein